MKCPIAFVVFTVISLAAVADSTSAADPYETARLKMVRLIETDVSRTSTYLDKKALDTDVMAAMATVPRHLFVPDDRQRFAYENRPLPIGYGQTISQPYIVAVMTDLLKPAHHHTVLEVGTGSGYQAAILSKLVKQVYSIEIIEPLCKKAINRLEKLEYDNIHVRFGDGYYGWKAHAPFDLIVVTAAAGHIPPPLLEQLKPGGRMVIPVGSRFLVQQLVLVEKDSEGRFSTRQILPVSFVPLTGEHRDGENQ